MLFLASAAFGLEGLVKRDLIRLGAADIRPQNTGGVLFSGDAAMRAPLRRSLTKRRRSRGRTIFPATPRFPSRRTARARN